MSGVLGEDGGEEFFGYGAREADGEGFGRDEYETVVRFDLDEWRDPALEQDFGQQVVVARAVFDWVQLVERGLADFVGVAHLLVPFFEVAVT